MKEVCCCHLFAFDLHALVRSEAFLDADVRLAASNSVEFAKNTIIAGRSLVDVIVAIVLQEGACLGLVDFDVVVVVEKQALALA